MKCLRCDADENSINGYCSNYCLDVHVLEIEIESLNDLIDNLNNRLLTQKEIVIQGIERERNLSLRITKLIEVNNG